MEIDFDKIPSENISRMKGGEKEVSVKMFSDGTNRIMKAVLGPGSSIGIHTHEDSCETILVTEGRGSIIQDGVKSKVEKGMCLYCPKGHTHSLINDSEENLSIFAVIPAQ